MHQLLWNASNIDTGPTQSPSGTYKQGFKLYMVSGQSSSSSRGGLNETVRTQSKSGVHIESMGEGEGLPGCLVYKYSIHADCSITHLEEMELHSLAQQLSCPMKQLQSMINRAVSHDVTRTNYDVTQKSGHFGAHRKCMGQNRNFIKRER